MGASARVAREFISDSRTHNAANELTGRDTDTSGVDNYALTYDAVGNLTNDGQTYKFEYDAFGRLRKIKDQSNNLVEEFRYNGLNHRIAWLHDADADNDVDGSDPWFSFVYDRSWRMVASYRGSDSEAKELFVNHQAGLNGSGLALPLDAFILRDRNTSAYWAASVSSFSGERTYHCQNYLGGRGDVVAILTSTGKQMEQVRYSAYGVPFGIPAGDTNADGGVIATPDITQITGWAGGGGGYNVRGDFDLDGDVDNDDVNIVSSNFGKSVGWGSLSVGPNDTLTGFVGGFRKGYCGYEHDGTNPKIMHVRHRAYLADLGRWTKRDPLGYVDGANLYGYVDGMIYIFADATGTRRDWIYPPMFSPHPQPSPYHPTMARACSETHFLHCGATSYHVNFDVVDGSVYRPDISCILRPSCREQWNRAAITATQLCGQGKVARSGCDGLGSCRITHRGIETPSSESFTVDTGRSLCDAPSGCYISMWIECGCAASRHDSGACDGPPAPVAGTH